MADETEQTDATPPEPVHELAGHHRNRPQAGAVEQRAAEDVAVTGRRLHGVIPYGVRSAEMNGWSEVIEPGALKHADMSGLVLNVDHAGLPLARHPGTLQLEDRSDGLHWSAVLPESRSDVREAVQRGDLCASSWRMVVAPGGDEWRGDVRHVHRIAELRDCAVVQRPAYPSATAEYRSLPDFAPTSESDTPEPTEAAMPDENKGGGLTIEARSATDQHGDVEARVLDAIRSVKPGETRNLTTTSVSPIDTPELATYVFDKLRPHSVMLAAGIRVMTTTREQILFPRTVTDVSPSWTSEGIEISEGDPSWDQLTVVPSKLAHRIVASNESLDDAMLDLTGWLQSNLLKLLSLKLDIGLLEGNPGTGQPGVVGLKYQSGTQTIYQDADAGNGSALQNLDAVAQAIAAIEEVNATPSAIVMTPAAWMAAETLKDANHRYLLSPQQDPTQAPSRSLFGVPVYTTSQLNTGETRGTSSNSSSIYVFDASQIVLVRRADVTIEIDRYQFFSSDQSQIRAKMRVGFVLPQPQAVCRIPGVLPAS